MKRLHTRTYIQDLEKFKECVYKKLGISKNSIIGLDTIIENHFQNGYSEDTTFRSLKEIFKIEG